MKLNEKLLKNLGVGLVLLFGSRIIGGVHPGSDIDVGIVFFDKKIQKGKPVEVYGSLYEEFSKSSKKETIDIVYLEETPLSLQYKAINDGVILYEKSPIFFADYKEKILLNYFDFKFFEDIFNSAFLHI